MTHYGDRRLEFPIIQDHENVGTIAEIGALQASRCVSSATAWWWCECLPAGKAITVLQPMPERNPLRLTAFLEKAG